MQRRRSKSNKKPLKKKQHTKKGECSACEMKLGVAIHMQHALLRKHTSQHYSYLQLIDHQIGKAEQKSPHKQYLQKYYSSMQRKHQFSQIKQIYKLHNQSPRLFMPEIRDILHKCHHRKRLLDYFKIAKILGLKVQSVKLSTFLLSASKSINPDMQKQSYDRIIGHISGYEFSENIEQQLLEAMEKQENQEQKLGNCVKKEEILSNKQKVKKSRDKNSLKVSLKRIKNIEKDQNSTLCSTAKKIASGLRLPTTRN